MLLDACGQPVVALGCPVICTLPTEANRDRHHSARALVLDRHQNASTLSSPGGQRVALSLRAMQEDPWPRVAPRSGQVVTGPVAKIVSFGVFVRIEDRADGFEGLVHTSELDESTGDVVEVGDVLTVKIIDVDLARRRITLSQRQPRAPRHER
ncbi:S1 RNA-binding domain-containing protein [Nocardia fusca]|uniref:S1 RNA-binding domain-containing protein n=1 Tax=Nocardia fusca TaxID=941183 RepID=UPI003F75C33D